MVFSYFLIHTTERCDNCVSGTGQVILTAKNSSTSVRVMATFTLTGTGLPFGCHYCFHVVCVNLH